MLIYSPSYDIYHGAFRQLAILDSLQMVHIEFSRLRLYDYYLLFPKTVNSFTNTARSRKFITDISKLHNTYNNPIDHKRVFVQVERIQIASMLTLQSRKLIDVDSKHDEYSITKQFELEELDDGMQEKLKAFQERNEPVLTFIKEILNTLNFYGKKGLKDRSNLLQAKYDSI